jgi:hypothetical protein
VSNTNAPRRQGNWQTTTPQAPTVAILQPTAIPSTATTAAGTGAAPSYVGAAFGVGAPTFSAMNGTLYIRRDGTAGATTLLYVNTSGANTIGTTWTGVTIP